jgi:hypothetical protein
MFLASSTNSSTADPGAINGDTTAPYVPAGTAVSGTYCFNSADPAAYCPAAGTVTYTDGTNQSYVLTIPDWISGPATLAAAVLPHWNRPSGQLNDPTKQPKIYPFTVPLIPGKTIASVTLPDVSNQPTAQGLHIFSMATRNTTTGTIQANGTTATPAAGKTWTGAWASPTELNSNFLGAGINYSNQTFRTAVKPSISGNTVRIKLDDALGTSPLSIGHATIALDGGTPPTSVPTGTIYNLTFGGAAGTTIPQGGMVFSDPLTFAVTANQWLLVSFTLTNTVPLLVQHSWASNTDHTYVSKPGSGDHTTDTTTTAFTGTGTHSGTFTDVLTNLDVTTAGIATQVVYGDGLVDAWQPNTAPNGTTGIRLSDDLASAEPTTPTPYGTIAEGVESNDIMTDNPQTHPDSGRAIGGPSALSRIDRDLLDQPGVTTAVLDEGLEDILNGQTADQLEANGYTELLSYLQAANINTIAIGLHPCDGYTGDGATGNSTNDPCTPAVDGNRTTLNGWLSGGYPLGMGPWSTPSLFYIDSDAAIGILNTADGLLKLDPNAAIASDHVNLTNPGYAALTSAYLGPQDTWQLNDADTDPAATAAADTATNANNPYLINNAAVGQNPATLTGGATWASDPNRGTVLNLDGINGCATTTTTAVNTAASFSVSGWVNLTTLPSSTKAVVAQDGTTASAFSLQYDYSNGTPRWAFAVTATDSATPGGNTAYSTTATTGWTHLVGVYNAATHTATLYVNGTKAATVADTAWASSGATTIGRAMSGGSPVNYLPGKLSHLQTWNYALADTQVTALYQQIA